MSSLLYWSSFHLFLNLTKYIQYCVVLYKRTKSSTSSLVSVSINRNICFYERRMLWFTTRIKQRNGILAERRKRYPSPGLESRTFSLLGRLITILYQKGYLTPRFTDVGEHYRSNSFVFYKEQLKNHPEICNTLFSMLTDSNNKETFFSQMKWLWFQ